MFEDMAGETKSGEEGHKAMKITVNGEDGILMHRCL